MGRLETPFLIIAPATVYRRENRHSVFRPPKFWKRLKSNSVYLTTPWTQATCEWPKLKLWTRCLWLWSKCINTAAYSDSMVILILGDLGNVWALEVMAWEMWDRGYLSSKVRFRQERPEIDMKDGGKEEETDINSGRRKGVDKLSTTWGGGELWFQVVCFL